MLNFLLLLTLQGASATANASATVVEAVTLSEPPPDTIMHEVWATDTYQGQTFDVCFVVYE